MSNKILARKIFAGIVTLIVSTMLVLLARNYNFIPERLPPEYRIKGNLESEIKIEEFTDFSCSACAHSNGLVENLLKVYKGRIVLKFKHCPLSSIHRWSFKAAAAAECAGEQGKFFEYGNLLFENAPKWMESEESPEKMFLDFANKLNLDKKKFQKCMKSEKPLINVFSDRSEARMRSVNATPTFFVNGKRAVGALQLLNELKKFEKGKNEK